MKKDNASIIIDIVMGQLEKKEQFSSQLSRITEGAITRGINNASKVRKTALNNAIVNQKYTETPASKRAINKLAKQALKATDEAVAQYNRAHSHKGGFMNFLGSLAVNTGILKFGQGYKGGNFFRDRYVDTNKVMDSKGNISTQSHLNYGRVGGDILSMGQFVFQAMTQLFELVGQSMERINPALEEGISNVKEVMSIANTIGYKGSDLKSISAFVGVVDSLFAGTNRKNAASSLINAMGLPKNKQRIIDAGFQGKDVVAQAGDYLESIRSGNRITVPDGKGGWKTRQMTTKEIEARDTIAVGLDTQAFTTQAKQQLSSVNQPLFGPNGGSLEGKQTLYQKQMTNLGGQNLTTDSLNTYVAGLIDANMKRNAEMNVGLMGKTGERGFEHLLELEKAAIEREMRYFEKWDEVVASQKNSETVLVNIKDAITMGATKIVNAIGGSATKTEKAIAELEIQKTIYEMSPENIGLKSRGSK